MKNNETLHYAHPTGLALSFTAGTIYIVCATAVAFWPTLTMRLFNNWFHGVDLTKIAVTSNITVWSFINGFITIVIFTYLAGVLYTWTYNKCVEHCKRYKWI